MAKTAKLLNRKQDGLSTINARSEKVDNISLAVLTEISGYISESFLENSANWNTAFSWGDHATAGYVTVSTNQDITGVKNFTNNLGAGVSNPSSPLHVQRESTEDLLALHSYVTNAGTGSVIGFYSAGGTASVPAAKKVGEAIGAFKFYNYQTSSFGGQVAQWLVFAREVAGNPSSSFEFRNRDSANALVTRFAITETGNVGFGTANPTNNVHVVDGSEARLTVEGTSTTDFPAVRAMNDLGHFANIGIGASAHSLTHIQNKAVFNASGGSSGLVISDSSGTAIEFYVGGLLSTADRVGAWKTAGLGIGTPLPEEKMHIAGGNLLLDAYSVGTGSGIFFRKDFSPNGSSNSEAQQRNVSIRVRGLGSTESPDGLEINGWDGIVFGTGGVDRMAILNNGDIELKPGASGNVTSFGDMVIQKGNPWLTLNSLNSGATGGEQGAGISVGESGYKGAAALHMTYTGDGIGRIGMGAIDLGTGIPANWAMEFYYQNQIVNFSSTPTVTGNTVWHAGNDGAGSGLDADKLDGYHASVGMTANTIPLRSSVGDIYARMFRSTYGEQTTAPAATADIAFRNDAASDNFIRFMTRGALVDWMDSVDTSSIQTISGRKVFNSTGTFQSSPSRTLEVASNTPNDAMMAFHVNGDYAVYFGLDASTNDLAVGGWSMGAVAHKVWHAGNDGAGSGLDADNLDGMYPTNGNIPNTIAQRDSSGHCSFNYVYSNFLNISHVIGTRSSDTVFYSSTDNFIRKNNAAGMRASLNVPSKSSFEEINSSWKFTDTSELRFGTSADYRIYHDGTNNYLRNYSNTASTFFMSNGSTGTNHHCIIIQGNTTAPYVRLYYNSLEKLRTISGGIQVYGSGTATDWIATSDRKLKQNIEALDSETCLKNILSLKPSSFVWKESGKSDTGFIAQEVRDVLPNKVQENIDSDTKESCLAMSYGKLTTELTGAIQEQQKQIDRLVEIVKRLGG